MTNRAVITVFLLFNPIMINAASITVNTSSQRAAISPYIYGANWQLNGDENLTIMRLGGNRMTGYNWENNASNAGADWYHSSDTYLCGSIDYPLSATECASSAGGVIDHFVDYCIWNNYASIVTLPMAGYVAADKNGDVLAGETAPSARWKIAVSKKGSAFQYPPDLTDNYVYADEAAWHLVQKYGNASTPNGVKFYLLDNEGDLWNSTHPRIHPTPVGAAEWLTRGVALSKAIKDVDPYADVFGPVFFGIWSMRNVGADWNAVRGGHTWYAGYYLDQMRQASIADGRRLLDAIDIHWYTESREGLYPPFNYSSGQCRVTEDACNSSAAQLSRMQAPRTLWDSTYTENSSVGEWCGAQLPLLVKVQEAIDAYYPGTKIAFTEHSHGGGNDYSGGIALADTLGIFGKYGVYVATIWESYKPFTSAAFRIYRNYDGANSTYGDTRVQCDSSDIPNITAYASINGTDESELHIIVINKAATAQTANVAITSSFTYNNCTAWAFGGAASAITSRTPPAVSGNSFSYSVPAHSVFHFVLNSTGTPTQTVSRTATPAFTVTRTRTATPTRTASGTPALTSTFTPVLTPTITPTQTPVLSPTRTPVLTPTLTTSLTPVLSPTFTRTFTPVLTHTFTGTSTLTVTPTVTPFLTLTPTVTGTSAVSPGDIKALPSLCDMTKGCDRVVFTGLSSRTKLRIYSISGGLVYKTDRATPGGTFTWYPDRRVKSNKTSSGVYIYVIFNENDDVVKGRFSLIR